MSLAISIIVAIYNSERTLCKCLDSLLKQTFIDFEVLLIDDGSSDYSGSICDDYAEQDNRVKVIHKVNGGVASARQCGIENACGEYTIHVDPDDWVDCGMLEHLYNIAKKNNADMVICDYYLNSFKGQEYIKQEPSSLNNTKILNDLMLGKLHGSTCNKLVRREYFKKYEIKFPIELKALEDLYVITSLVKYKIKIVYLPMAFYHYVRESTHTSLSFIYTSKSYEDDIITRDLFNKLMYDTPIANVVNIIFQNRIVYHAFWSGDKYYSSKKFNKVFNSFKYDVMHSNGSLIIRLCVYMSCVGLYRPIKSIFNMLLFIKKTIVVLLKK